MSKDFFEMVLPNPPPSAVAAGFWFTMLCSRGRAGETDCRRPAFSVGAAAVRGSPGRDLSAETGRSGNFVRRFAGTRREKSEGTAGFWVGLAALPVALRRVGVDGL